MIMIGTHDNDNNNDGNADNDSSGNGKGNDGVCVCVCVLTHLPASRGVVANTKLTKARWTRPPPPRA
jgi:hypothetical protein